MMEKLSEKRKLELQLFAETIRLNTLRQFKTLGFGHVGGAMSIVETLAVLYGQVMRIDPRQPDWPERDWLVMSKGHAGPALYAALALKGYFPLAMLETLNKAGTSLPSHCDRNLTTGVDMTTGSLGQGMSTAIGVALGHRLDERDNHTFLILGDGECDEGQVWEGALSAAHFRVDRLIAFVDRNQQQLDGYTKDILDIGDIGAKFAQFGWFVQSVDGADVGAVHQAVMTAKEHRGSPSMIVLNTIKGKGCGFAEGVLNNHHMTVSSEQANEAIINVERRISELAGSIGY